MASIALGVALLSGTLVLTNTMGIAFDQLFGKIGSGTDVVVRTEAPYSASEGVGTTRGPIDAKVLDQVVMFVYFDRSVLLADEKKASSGRHALKRRSKVAM